MWISNGWMADVVIVVAVTNREAKSPAHGIRYEVHSHINVKYSSLLFTTIETVDEYYYCSLFIVENGTPGFKKTWLMKKIGLNAFVSNF